MSLQSENTELYTNLEYYRKSTDKPHIIFLHGFTGSSNDWADILPQVDNSFSKIVIDLPGHGKSTFTDPKFYNSENLSLLLNNVIEKLGIRQAILLGYSMGGRAALTYTFSFPDKVKGLILESTTAGIESENERIERRESDRKLAEGILQNGTETFVDYWISIPLFTSQKRLPDKTLKELRINKLKNSSKGLTNSLIEFGTGSMPSYWEKLPLLNMPVQLITGSLDKKYNDINRRITALVPNAVHSMIEDAGHNTHLEKAHEFIILVNSFLKNNYC